MTYLQHIGLTEADASEIFRIERYRYDHEIVSHAVIVRDHKGRVTVKRWNRAEEAMPDVPFKQTITGEWKSVAF